MAEQNQNKTDSDSGNFYNEILSPSELFAARARSHKIPVRGQKEFIPNDSDEQKQRLQQSLDEHWGLISEERVERQGNLVKAKWIPSEHVVELQSPAGKFWQTMGFSAAGKQCLLPEEALYLMECGSVQVFHQDLPLSIQDGYERFLSSSTVSLQQYQVFGHLKRLGYVVHRFDASAEPSSYARQLNLPCDRSTRQAKRKRSPSPTPANSRMDTQDASTTESKKGPSREESEADKKVPDSQMSVTLGSSAAQDSMETSPGECGGRKWWLTDAGRQHQSHPRESSGSHRWDRSVPFPDLGSSRKASSCLPSPDPALLPGGLSVGKCDVSRWEHRINLRKVKMSAREEEREREMRRRRSDINRDKEVQRCRNWAEYQQLLARRQGTHRGRPSHLWHSEVTPLHDPTQPIPTGELLDKISVIKSTHLHEDASRLEASKEWRICFNVYQPDSVADFKKSNPGKPYARMCVCSFDGPVPDLRAMKLLAFQSGDIPVVYAVVDYGDISFYTFKTFQLPKDVFP